MTDNEKVEKYLLVFLLHKDAWHHRASVRDKLTEQGVNDTLPDTIRMLDLLTGKGLVKHEKGNYLKTPDVDYYQIKQDGITFINNIRKRKILQYLVERKNKRYKRTTVLKDTLIYELDFDYLTDGMAKEDQTIAKDGDISTEIKYTLYANDFSHSKLMSGAYLNDLDLFQKNTNKMPVEKSPSKKPEVTERLRAKMTAEQLTFLFRLLSNCNIIVAKKAITIHEFISEHFDTASGKKLSPMNIGKMWSLKNDDLVNFWIKNLTDLINEAKRKKK